MLGQQTSQAAQADGGFHRGRGCLLRSEDIDVLVAHVVDLWIRGVDQQVVSGEGRRQVSGRELHLVAIEPLVIVCGRRMAGMRIKLIAPVK